MKLSFNVWLTIGLALACGVQAEVHVVKNNNHSQEADVGASWNGTEWNAVGDVVRVARGSAGTYGGKYKGLSRYVLKFPLSTLKVGAEDIAQATLRLFVEEVTPDSPKLLEIYASTVASLGNVEISDFDNGEYSLIGTVSVAETGWIDVDVTDAVVAAFAASRNPIVSAFRIQVQGDLLLPEKPLQRAVFIDNYSAENDPELVITTKSSSTAPSSVFTVGLLF